MVIWKIDIWNWNLNLSGEESKTEMSGQTTLQKAIEIVTKVQGEKL